MTLMTGAQDIANYRCELLSQKFEHSMPDGVESPVYIDENGNEIGLGAENIGKMGVVYKNGAIYESAKELAKRAVNMWYESVNHRFTMTLYTSVRMGVGLYVDTDGTAYVEQFFTPVA